jgi:hypothetical protein
LTKILSLLAYQSISSEIENPACILMTNPAQYIFQSILAMEAFYVILSSGGKILVTGSLICAKWADVADIS